MVLIEVEKVAGQMRKATAGGSKIAIMAYSKGSH
jgi:hypothetical protein